MPNHHRVCKVYNRQTKLREVSKELYLEHGWQMPRGFTDSKERDPRNFTLAEWQQAKRMGRDAAALKATIQECWSSSGNGAAFAAALEQRGLYLARGDKRGHVAVTYEGEVLSIARMTGKRAKDMTAKLGSPDALRSVAGTRSHIASVIVPRLEGLLKDADMARLQALAPLEAKRLTLRDVQKTERQKLDEGHRLRAVAEAKARNARLRSGVMGLWDCLTGRRAETIRHNEADALQSRTRDRTERHELVSDQLGERRTLQKNLRAVRDTHAAVRDELYRDLSAQQQSSEAERDSGLRGTFTRASAGLRRTERSRGSSEANRQAGRGPRGPDLSR